MFLLAISPSFVTLVSRGDMKSIVHELEEDASNSSVPVTDLLAKAKIVASKLELKEFLSWVNSEINGYRGKDEIPDYRKIHGQVKAFNPYYGWQTVVIEDPKFHELLATREILQPIGELENVCDINKSGNLTISLPPSMVKTIVKGMGQDMQVEYFVSKSQVIGILNGVRNGILDWSLKLEEKGIVGSDLSFSRDDKEKAQSKEVHYEINHIENFIGMGNVHNQGSLTINQGELPIEEIKDLIRQVEKYSDSITTEETLSAIKQETIKLKKEIESKEPSQLKLKDLLTSLRSAAEGAAGNLVAQGVIFMIDEIVKHAKHLPQ